MDRDNLLADPLLQQICKPWINAKSLEASQLTPSGCPMEISFRTSGARVFTFEPDVATKSPALKWKRISALSDMSPDSHPMLMELASQPDQSWGAWLGVRSSKGNCRFKVYQEITKHSLLNVSRRIATAISKSEGLCPKIFGFDGVQEEYYCRIEQPGFDSIHRLLSVVGAGIHSLEVCLLLAELAGRRPEELFREVPLGISYRFVDNRATAATLFIHATSISADHNLMTRRIMHVAREIGGASNFDTVLDHWRPAWSTLALTVDAETIQFAAGCGLLT